MTPDCSFTNRFDPRPLLGLDHEVFRHYQRCHTIYSRSTTSTPRFNAAPHRLIKSLSDSSWRECRSQIKLLRNGNVCNRAVYSTPSGSFRIDAILHLFDKQGATVYIHGEGQFPNIVPGLTDYLEATTAFSTFSNTSWNVFATPPNAIGIEPHFDAHDLLIIQLYGSKKWIFWNSYTNIAETDFVPPEYYKRNRDYAASSPPRSVLLMKDGDVLYMPRMTVHAPRTGYESSVHLSVLIPPDTHTDETNTVSYANNRELQIFPTKLY